MQHRPQLWGVG